MDDKAQIQEAIKIQGEVVRKLKAEKASKEQVSVTDISSDIQVGLFARWSAWQGVTPSVLPQQ